VPSLRSNLFTDLDLDVTPDAPVGPMTWYGIGGRADMLVRPRTLESLETLAQRCHRSGVPLRILGSGANLLVADEGVDGIVVRLDEAVFQRVEFRDGAGGDDAVLMRAMAGADLARAVMEAARRGLDGISGLAGIPASIGGAVRMNAGGAYGAIGDVVETVTCLTRAGRRVSYPAAELEFGYRATNIPDPIILSATLRLVPADPVAVRRRVKEVFAYKKATQPLAESSAGCAFRNPIDPVTEKRVSAGRLIEEAGLKGERRGGATVSERHANFIVTEPGATARDVIELLEAIRARVFETAGLELEEEVVVWRRGEP
jgi:UDP-N-acetylmuramate dehydrogenase